MMKLNAILSFVLSILEGGLAGVCCYQGGKAENGKRKALWYITGAVWFVLSVLDGAEGSRALKEARAAASGESDDWEL